MPVLLSALITLCRHLVHPPLINCPLIWNHNSAFLIMNYPENLFKPSWAWVKSFPFWPWGDSSTDSGASLDFYLFKRDQKNPSQIPVLEHHLKNCLLWFTLDSGWAKTTQELSGALGCALGSILKWWSCFALFSHKEMLQEELSLFFFTAGLLHRAEFSIRHTQEPQEHLRTKGK